MRKNPAFCCIAAMTIDGVYCSELVSNYAKIKTPVLVHALISIERSFQDATFIQCLSKAIATIKHRLLAEYLRA